MAEEENAFDALFSFGKKKTTPPVLPKKASKKKKKVPNDKNKSKESEQSPYQKDISNQALKTDNENEINLKKKAESTEKVVGDRKKLSANGHESESEIDDVLVEILVAAAQRRAEPLSAQNMEVDVYGKTPLPTIERLDK